MKLRNDFVSNSSSCSFVVPIDAKNHDKTKWMKNTLNIQRDNNKIMMKFDDFSNSGSWKNDVESNWKFICSQLIYWIQPDLCFESSRDSIKKIVRSIYNHPEFIRLENAVKEYLPDCEGVEFDEEDLRQIKYDDSNDYYTILIPECQLDHNTVYDNFDDLLEQSKCSSIAELIWGVKEIRIIYS